MALAIARMDANIPLSDASLGLTGEAARRLLAKDGPNAIADVTTHPLARALGKLWAPVPWMLEAAILLQLGLRDSVEAGVVALLLVSKAGRKRRSMH
jgi:H+-transporting ATPase